MPIDDDEPRGVDGAQRATDEGGERLEVGDRVRKVTGSQKGIEGRVNHFSADGKKMRVAVEDGGRRLISMQATSNFRRLAAASGATSAASSAEASAEPIREASAEASAAPPPRKSQRSRPLPPAEYDSEPAEVEASSPPPGSRRTLRDDSLATRVQQRHTRRRIARVEGSLSLASDGVELIESPNIELHSIRGIIGLVVGPRAREVLTELFESILPPGSPAPSDLVRLKQELEEACRPVGRRPSGRSLAELPRLTWSHFRSLSREYLEHMIADYGRSDEGDGYGRALSGLIEWLKKEEDDD
jgi:hypothetical protein